MSDRLTATIDRLQQASTMASGYPVNATLTISAPEVKGFVVTPLTIPDLLFAAQELRGMRARLDVYEQREANMDAEAAATVAALGEKKASQ